MGVEISEHSDLPGWMREHLAAGRAGVWVGGREGTSADFLAAVEAATAADDVTLVEGDGRG